MNHGTETNVPLRTPNTQTSHGHPVQRAPRRNGNSLQIAGIAASGLAIMGGMVLAANKLAPKSESVNPTHKRVVVEHMTLLPTEQITLKAGAHLRHEPSLPLDGQSDNTATTVPKGQEFRIGAGSVYAITVESGDTWVGMLAPGAAIPANDKQLLSEMVFADISQLGSDAVITSPSGNPEVAFADSPTMRVNTNGTLSDLRGAPMQLPTATAYHVQ